MEQTEIKIFLHLKRIALEEYKQRVDNMNAVRTEIYGQRELLSDSQLQELLNIMLFGDSSQEEIDAAIGETQKVVDVAQTDMHKIEADQVKLYDLYLGKAHNGELSEKEIDALITLQLIDDEQRETLKRIRLGG